MWSYSMYENEGLALADLYRVLSLIKHLSIVGDILRPDSIDFLFLKSSCILIIKKKVEQIWETEFFFF